METMIINQQNKVPYNRKLQDIIVKVANAAAKLCKQPKNTEVSIMIVDNSYIQELNLIYRAKNQATDVLSFAMNELGDEEPDLDFSGDINILGDIVISLEQAQVQSQEYEHSLERELGYLVVHGMLHLLGFDHENEEEKKLMRQLEDKVMQSLKLER